MWCTPSGKPLTTNSWTLVRLRWIRALSVRCRGTHPLLIRRMSSVTWL